MLINISNHPIEKWGDNQKELAEKCYGKIIDIPFPLIDPEATLEEVNSIANEYLYKIKKYTNEEIVVHLMGEFCFCFALLYLLKEEKITAIASTTERLVEYREGEKIVKFSFVKFRRYF